MVASLTVASLIVAAGCGSTTRATPRPTLTHTPFATTTPSPTVDPTDSAAAIISAYEQATETFDALAAIPEDDEAAYTKLKQWFTGHALDLSQETLEVNVVQGERLTGSLRFGNPSVTSLQDGTATVEDCAYTTLVTVSTATGQDVGIPAIGYILNTDTLVYEGGSWLVSSTGSAWQGANGCSASPSP